jgi:hypothetical protein
MRLTKRALTGRQAGWYRGVAFASSLIGGGVFRFVVTSDEA